MAKKVLYAAELLIKSVLLYCTAAQQWEAMGQPEVSKFGMMLQRHIFKRITGAGLSDVCLQECYADVRCQSFNYVFTQDICELSNRTKEARPEDYVPNPERFYFKRDYKRVPLGSNPELPAETCQEIKMSEGGEVVSGKYWFHTIVPERTVLAPCDMKTEDVDECNSTIPVCDANAECENTIGSHRCSCKAGFTGNGKKCVDVDECTSTIPVCDVNAECVNTISSHSCLCKAGFTGNGKKCVDFDECANKSHDCDVNAFCNNTIGSYQCTCNPWYQGKGTSCYFREFN
nr:adhesion G protein-coupled receptor E5-like [Pocillopora verrucosa]